MGMTFFSNLNGFLIMKDWPSGKKAAILVPPSFCSRSAKRRCNFMGKVS